MNDLKKQLHSLLEREALKRGSFVLSSGAQSAYYLDGRVITLTSEGAYLVAQIIRSMIVDPGIQAIGGPTIGADPIVGAVCALSAAAGSRLQGFIVRKAAKGHGTQKQVEGPALAAGARVVLVDDVATSGGSLIEAQQALDRLGVVCKEAIVIVDRLEGASENLAKIGLTLRPIFTIKDFGL